MPPRTNHRKLIETGQPDGVGQKPTIVVSPSDPLFLLLDTLIALRLEFANDMEGERRMNATHGRAKVLAVRTTLDKAIQGVKHTIDSTYGPTPSKLRPRPQVPVRRAPRAASSR